MLTENNLKVNLNSQQLSNVSWLVTMIKATLKTPIQKFKQPILSFRRTHAAAVRNSKILVALKGDLGAAIAAHKDRPVKYGSELRNIATLEKLFLHHEDKTKIINIIQHGPRYHIDPIKEETRK